MSAHEREGPPSSHKGSSSAQSALPRCLALDCIPLQEVPWETVRRIEFTTPGALEDIDQSRCPEGAGENMSAEPAITAQPYDENITMVSCGSATDSASRCPKHGAHVSLLHDSAWPGGGPVEALTTGLNTPALGRQSGVKLAASTV